MKITTTTTPMNRTSSRACMWVEASWNRIDRCICSEDNVHVSVPVSHCTCGITENKVYDLDAPRTNNEMSEQEQVPSIFHVVASTAVAIMFGNDISLLNSITYFCYWFVAHTILCEDIRQSLHCDDLEEFVELVMINERKPFTQFTFSPIAPKLPESQLVCSSK